MDGEKVALVTGGARRIGAAIVRDLASHGFAVAIHCHSGADEAERLAGEIAEGGGRAAVVVSDLTDRAAAAGLMAEASRAFGAPSLLVNNASVFEDDSAGTVDWQAWDRHFAVHLEAPVKLAEAFAAARAGKPGGLIVNMIDQRVKRLTPRFFSYTLSKAALWTATRTMAQAFAPHVRVNAIGPGPTLPSPRQSPEDFARQAAAVPLGTGPMLTEIGGTIRYLWETPSITGQMIALDGGQHLAWQTPDVTGIGE